MLRQKGLPKKGQPRADGLNERRQEVASVVSEWVRHHDGQDVGIKIILRAGREPPSSSSASESVEGEDSDQP